MTRRSSRLGAGCDRTESSGPWVHWPDHRDDSLREAVGHRAAVARARRAAGPRGGRCRSGCGVRGKEAGLPGARRRLVRGTTDVRASDDIWTPMQYRTLVRAEVLRVRCAEHGVQQVQVRWAEAQSGFTALLGLSRAVLNFASGSSLSLYEVVHVTPRQQPGCRAGPVRPRRRPGDVDRGSRGPAGSAVPPPPERSPPSVGSSGRRATA